MRALLATLLIALGLLIQSCGTSDPPSPEPAEAARAVTASR